MVSGVARQRILLIYRQLNSKLCAFGFRSFYLYFPSMRPHNIIRQRQSQSCSLPSRFRCEEWLKYFIKDFLWNAIAIVLNQYSNNTIISFSTNGNGGLIAGHALL